MSTGERWRLWRLTRRYLHSQLREWRLAHSRWSDEKLKLTAEIERLKDENRQLTGYVQEAAGDESCLMPIATLTMLSAERDRLAAEIHRLRARTHEIQAAADQRNRELARRVGQYEAAFARAREEVKHIRADWTTDPPSQEEHGFWRYTSSATADALALMASKLIEAEEALEVAKRDAFIYRERWLALTRSVRTLRSQ